MQTTKSKTKALQIREKERGLVPGRANGKADRVYGSYLDTLDPRGNDEVQLALAASPDPRFKEFLERLNMPRYKKVSLQTLAKACNITLAQFNQWWQTSSAQRAIATAQTGSVIITRDMVEDARTQSVVCGRCEGLGFIAAQPGLPDETPGYRMITAPTSDSMAEYIRDCPFCSAKRTVRKPGDAHARDKILEMSGLVKKGAAVQIVQNFGGAMHSSALTEMDGVVTLDISKEN